MLETNPYILGVTIVVSLVHTVFEFLAFKNGKFTPCSHWNLINQITAKRLKMTHMEIPIPS